MGSTLLAEHSGSEPVWPDAATAVSKGKDTVQTTNSDTMEFYHPVH